MCGVTCLDSLARVAITRTDLLIIDDWLLTPLTSPERHEILEVIEDRHERASTLIASQVRSDLPPWLVPSRISVSRG